MAHHKQALPRGFGPTPDAAPEVPIQTAYNTVTQQVSLIFPRDTGMLLFSAAQAESLGHELLRLAALARHRPV